jgi:DNA-binding protein H-NS
MGITPKSIVKKVKDLIDGVYSEKSGKEAERLEQAAVQRAKVEDMSEKDIARAHQAAGKADDGARPQPGVRKSRPSARPADRSEGAGLWRGRGRPHRAADPGLNNPITRVI